MIWCTHNFFNPFIHHEFSFLEYILHDFFLLPPTLCRIFFFFGGDGVNKVGFPLRIKLYTISAPDTKGSVQYSLNKHINPRTYKRIRTPTVVQGGGGMWMEPLPGVFYILQYFETILPLVESL